MYSWMLDSWAGQLWHALGLYCRVCTLSSLCALQMGVFTSCSRMRGQAVKLKFLSILEMPCRRPLFGTGTEESCKHANLCILRWVSEFCALGDACAKLSLTHHTGRNYIKFCRRISQNNYKDCAEKMAGLNQAQFFETIGCGGTSTITTTLERKPAEGVDKNSSDPIVQTLCKLGRLKEALHLLKQPGVQVVSSTYLSLLQGCINVKGLAEGKQVHTHIILSGFKPNIFLLNNLINMYVKCGSLLDARPVFNDMPERDMFTWTMMVAGYAKHGHAEEALKIYKQMQQQGVTPDKVTFICVLNACASLGVLEKGKKLHADIIKAGISAYVNLENSLVDMYAKCGSITDARGVFDNMAKRNVVSWSAMITGYAQHGCSSDALKMYEQMQWEGVMPNRVTFVSILNACSSLGNLEKGKQVHADILETGIASDVILETALVDMYAKCGSIHDARQVFDQMSKRNVVSWNAMISGYAKCGCCNEAFTIYDQMRQEGVMPDMVTFICTLKVCSSIGDLEKGEKVHADIIQTGILSCIDLENTLLDMYAKCGSMKNARQVFNNMVKRDVISWTAMIAGYAQHECGAEAFDLYERMHEEKVRPSTVTFVCVLKSCASQGALEKGNKVYADIIKAGSVSDIVLETALVDMYAKCGIMEDACQIFDNMAKRDVISWNAMIAGYSRHRSGRAALKIYDRMLLEGVTPNRVTFICVLNACASLGALEKGKEVHDDMSKAGMMSYINLENALVDMYAKCGSIADARQVFNNIAKRDVISWSAMIAGCAHHGYGREALQLFEQMQKEGVKPNGITFISLLFACSHVGLVDEGRQYFESMSQAYGLAHTVEHFCCMVDLLGRAGRLDEATDFIKKMPIEPDASLWGTLLGACRIHGDAELAERAISCIIKWDSEHTAARVLLSDIYAAASRWEDKAKVAKVMQDRGGVIAS